MTSESPAESFAALFEQQAQKPGKRRTYRVGDKIEGRVVRVGSDSVFVELDGKQQAYLDGDGLRLPDGTIPLKEGDMVSAHVVEADDRTGQIRLARTMGRATDIAGLERAREGRIPVEGKVSGVNKGGLEIEIAGVKAFCPVSQIDAGFVQDPSVFVGQSLRFIVTEVREGGRRVVLSRKALLQDEAAEASKELRQKLVPGVTVRGTVTAVRDFGAFIDLGGIEGLIPRSEIAHDRGASISDMLKAGDTVDVLVRDVKDGVADRNGQRSSKVTLSLKALAADPWENLDLAQGRVIDGVVTRVVEFGAFVRVAPGVEGLVHASELGGKRDEALRALTPGKAMRVVVQSISLTDKKISLVPAPDGIATGTTVSESRVSVGAIVKGAVDRIEAYGLFLQIEGTRGKSGRGLLPISELGVARGTDLRKAFPEGTILTAKVLEVGDGRIRLSLKAAKDDEERADFVASQQNSAKHGSLGTFADLLKKAKR